MIALSSCLSPGFSCQLCFCCLFPLRSLAVFGLFLLVLIGVVRVGTFLAVALFQNRLFTAVLGAKKKLFHSRNQSLNISVRIVCFSLFLWFELVKMMEYNLGVVKTDDQMELPPGFRFHPTDEELITHYLSRKVLDNSFSAVAVGEVDMNKIEPWDLPWKAKLGEKEWYFFCLRDKKYPTGLRTNRATAEGYWKATGKDKEIFRGKSLVGMKKTLVFYKGRAPKGEKSNWVCHEYRLEGKLSLDNLAKASKNDWVIGKVFQKTAGGKHVHISGLVRMNSVTNELAPPALPPLMDSSQYSGRTKPSELESSHVHCFSNNIVPAPQKIQGDFINCFNNPAFPSSSNPLDFLTTPPGFSWGQFLPTIQPGMGSQFPGEDTSILRAFLGSYGQNPNLGFGKERDIVSVSQETVLSTDNTSVISNLEMGRKPFEEQESPADLNRIWGY